MSTTTPAERIQEAIRLIESVASDAHGQGFGSRELGGSDLIEMVGLAEQAGRLVGALQVEVAHEVHARTPRKVPADVNESLAHSYGFASAIELLKQMTRESGATLTRRVTLASACRTEISLLGDELPGRFGHVGAALFRGQINAATAELITRELGKVRSNVDFETRDAAERTLVAYATGSAHDGSDVGTGTGTGTDPVDGFDPLGGFPMHIDDLKRLTTRVVTLLDQDGALPREEQLARRHFKLGAERDGLVPVYGAVTVDVAAGLARMFDAILNPRAGTNEQPLNDQPDGVASRVKFVAADDAEAHSVLDDRTPDQKRHDAFATICAIARKHEDMPKLGGEAVSLTIQCSEEALLKRRGTAWLTDHFGQPAPVDSAAARHAACAGSLLRVAQDKNGRIIELDSAARIFNAHQRKAIMLRDGGCIIPGCSQSAIWCEIHHVQEWRDDGKTHTDNGVMLCWHHHRHIETHGWEIRMVDGVPQVKAPPWRDPEGKWRAARSVHKPPQLLNNTHTRTHASNPPPKRPPRTESQPPERRTSACSVRTTTTIPARNVPARSVPARSAPARSHTVGSITARSSATRGFARGIDICWSATGIEIVTTHRT